MLITVRRCFDPWEAHILRARLEAEGIPASVAGDQHVIADWPLSVALGGAALQVPSACLEPAQGVIAAYHAGSLEQDLIAEYPEAAETCPACGSAAVAGSVPAGQRMLLIAVFLLAAASFPTRASRMQCKECGHGWRYGETMDGLAGQA